MRKRSVAIVLIIVVALLAALFIGVKAEVIRPNMIFVPTGTQGVDVSEHQGEIDTEALADAGIAFVYAKATEGSSHVDSQFLATCDKVAGGSIPLGAYHFFSSDSPGADQATSFVATAARAWNDPNIRSLVPAVDVEWYGDKEENPPAAEDVRRELTTFIETVEAACGHKPPSMRATTSTTAICRVTSTIVACGSPAASGLPGSSGHTGAGPSGSTAMSATWQAPPTGQAMWTSTCSPVT